LVDKSLARRLAEAHAGRPRSLKEGESMGDNGALAAAFEEALKSGDFNKMGETLMQYGTDDFVDEWPQSGERLSKQAMIKMAESYGEATGTNPSFTYKRMLGGGDVFVVEGTIDYGDGVPVSYVGIGEVRDGKVAKMTEYFANPFEAPAWRADFVERMEPTPA
jgi:SnoaL-like protein